MQKGKKCFLWWVYHKVLHEHEESSKYGESENEESESEEGD